MSELTKMVVESYAVEWPEEGLVEMHEQVLFSEHNKATLSADEWRAVIREYQESTRWIVMGSTFKVISTDGQEIEVSVDAGMSTKEKIDFILNKLNTVLTIKDVYLNTSDRIIYNFIHQEPVAAFL